MQVVVIGNAPNRKLIDLEVVKESFFTIGCNALYRDFEPDILVAADKGMQEEILASEYSGRTIFHKRSIEYPPGQELVSERMRSSGLYAIRYAKQLECSHIYLIGFNPQSGYNMYDGTHNYRRSSALGGSQFEVSRHCRDKRVIWVTDLKKHKKIERRQLMTPSNFIKLADKRLEKGS